MVPESDTVIYPRAVMVKSFNALFADSTVLAPRCTHTHTIGTDL
jgi:hypothetical protein